MFVGFGNTSWVRAKAAVIAVAIVAFPAAGAPPDTAPAAEAPTSPMEAPLAAPLSENPAPAPAAETSAPTPGAQALVPPPQPETPPLFKAEQLDQLLAPIALYPDALLAQILMAATYPLEVVKADRWLQDPAHTHLQGDQLAGAVEAEAWDPSVKSLVPFSQILRMMDEKLDWTEQLGTAVLAQQTDVMDSIQRLRHQAAAAGTLWSNDQQRVTTERQGIVIEPAHPEFVYPPVYSSAVYGPWPSPDYPPFDMYPSDFGFGLPLPLGIGFGAGFAVVQPLWRWCAFDWGQRRIKLDVVRFNALNHRRPGIGTSTWQHDPFHRLAGPGGAVASRASVQVLRGPAITAAAIPRVSFPNAAASASVAGPRQGSPAFAAARPLPMARLRSAMPAFAPGGAGLQRRIGLQPGLAGRQPVALSMMPPQFPRPMMPRTVARSASSAPGSRAPVAGVSHR
jgi:hypothetical protein